MRGLVSLRDLSDAQVASILELAGRCREGFHPEGSLRGRTVTTLFYEPSTRTRVSFERAARLLGAEVLGFDPAGSSVEKGEGLADTVSTLAAMGSDLFVVRHPMVDVPALVQRWSGVPVVNAGAGRGEHPTQSLTDALTLVRRFGSLKGLRMGIVGDVANSRVARSHLELFPRLGMELSLIGPATLLPDHDPWGVSRCHHLDPELGDLDVVYLLRVQAERGAGRGIPSLGGYARRFGLGEDRLSSLKPSAVIMHPGPLNRGVEIDDAAADGEQSLIREQVANGVPLRMAVLAQVMGVAS